MALKVALFFTHAGALRFERELKSGGLDCLIKPTPRSLSSSCGICAEFEADRYEPFLIEDIDRIYEKNNQHYIMIYENPIR